jgi:P-type E1-E2 ATPase
LADRAAGWLVWYALVAAVITTAIWVAVDVPENALVRAITVMVIACPHALGLAIPLVVSISTERAARGGVLVKDRGALERMRTVDTVLFHKTGTLTKGEPVLNQVATTGAYTADELLALAAATKADSKHPLARTSGTAAMLYPAAHHRFCFIFRYPARESWITENTERGSSEARMTPAEAIATSVPAPNSMPTSGRGRGRH